MNCFETRVPTTLTFCALLFCLTTLCNAQSPSFVIDPSAPLVNVKNSTVAFSDVDGDGDQDMFISGYFFIPRTDLYINDGAGGFTMAVGTPFAGLYYSCMVVTDIDADGDEDMFITGLDTVDVAVAKLYTNDGLGSFTEVVGTTLKAVSYGSCATADVDADGDPDLMVTGMDTAGVRIANLYTNDGAGVFTEVAGTSFIGVDGSSIGFSDIDADNDLDLLISGRMSSSDGITKLYTNDGAGNFTEVLGTGLVDVARSSIAFADIDGDNDEDLFITGARLNIVEASRLYSNDGNGNFTEILGTGIQGVMVSEVVFADVDSDGDPDLLVTGWDINMVTYSKLYTNDGGGSFTEVLGTPFISLLEGAAAFADVDSDNDLDLLMAGWMPSVGGGFTNTTELYLNCNSGEKWFLDTDGDGYGSVLSDSITCSQPVGYVLDSTDCDDMDPALGGAMHWYLDADTDGFGDHDIDSIDCVQPVGYVLDSSDCDDTVPGQLLGTWYLDADVDGLGNAMVDSVACAQPTGYVADNSDCNDAVPGQGISIWFADADSDGFGDLAVDSASCAQPAGYIADSTDCDDSDDQIGSLRTWFLDGDGDGYGVAAVSMVSCFQPVGFVADSTECNDFDTFAYPGAACDDGDPASSNDAYDQNCTCAGKYSQITLRMFLEGPYNSLLGLMNDDLRVAGYIPLTEPYTALGYAYENNEATTVLGASGATIDPAVLTVTGPDAIVDWVIVELRDPTNPSEVGLGIVKSRAALLQRDGDVVDLDGISDLEFAAISTTYYIAVRHRNHLPAMTAVAGTGFGSPGFGADFTSSTEALWNNMPSRNDIDGVMVQATGDVTLDHGLKYTGANNDRDPILTAVGGSVPTAVVYGYFLADLTMDGTVKYAGFNNDRDRILVNIGGNVPTAVRFAPLP